MKEHKKKAHDSVAFYNNPDNRAIIYQVIAILVIAVFTYFILDNMCFEGRKEDIVKCI